MVINPELPPPPVSLLTGASLFLDIDGTLLDLVDDPAAVVADDVLRTLILHVADALAGRVAIISGRCLEQIETIFGSVAQLVALSGSHGNEHRWRGIEAHPIRPASLDLAINDLRECFGSTPGVLIEEKSFGVAVHFRRAPHTEEDLRQLTQALAERHDLQVQGGNMMIELRVGGGNKGGAVRRLMGRTPMAGTRPIFVGDDLTDEPAFLTAAELGGAGVVVGDRKGSAAQFRLGGPADVREWLEAFVA